MNIISLSYKDSSWELLNLELQNVNLLVGKNATGKSKTLQLLNQLHKILTQKKEALWKGQWNVIFKLDDKIIEYKFSLLSKSPLSNDQTVIYENLTVNDKLILDRNSEEVSILNFQTDDFEKVHPPINKLLIHTNRDTVKYPYFDIIANWAENSYGTKFGTIRPSIYTPKSEYDLLNPVDEISILFKQLSQSERQNIVEKMNSIGYEIETINQIETFSQDRDSSYTFLYVKENLVPQAIPIWELSQGMYRALAVLIFFEYLINNKKPATIAIDDLGEGLDYIRSKKLGKILFDSCQNSLVQLIATSNDAFLMDIINIESWNILKRVGSKVASLNIKNSPKLFEDFKYTGLSNFDFLSSSYMNSALNDLL